MQETGDESLILGLGRQISWRKKWQPTSVFLPVWSNQQRSLVCYSLWSHQVLGMTEHAHKETYWNAYAFKKLIESLVKWYAFTRVLNQRKKYFKDMLYILLWRGRNTEYMSSRSNGHSSSSSTFKMILLSFKISRVLKKQPLRIWVDQPFVYFLQVRCGQDGFHLRAVRNDLSMPIAYLQVVSWQSMAFLDLYNFHSNFCLHLQTAFSYVCVWTSVFKGKTVILNPKPNQL